MMRDALNRRLPAPHPRNAPDAIAKQRTAEIIAEVDAKYKPQWDAINERFYAAKYREQSI